MVRSESDRESGIVYSTEHGRMCPDCGKPVAKCACRKAAIPPAGDGVVRVGRETKGRKGKCVTLITGLPLDPDRLRDLAKELKRKCGTGGTTKAGVIQIQGEHRELLVEDLRARGYVVKRTGG
jgi:translation initiation factor 1